MTKNIGSTDRIIRIVIGIVLAVWGLVTRSWWGLLAVIPLGTAALGFCPLYLPFKIDTRKKG